MSGLIVLKIVVVFLAVLLFTWFVKRVATAKQILDWPTESRKMHTNPTPLWGGLAVIAATILGIVLLQPELVGGYLLPKQLWGIVGGGLLLAVGGALDDKYNLRPRAQIVWPILAALIIVAAGIGINYITNPFGDAWRLDSVNWVIFWSHGLPYKFTLWADLFTVAWLLGMMYTTKFLDGLDGLVSGIGVIGAVIIFVLSLTLEVRQPETALLAAVTGVALLGFLFFNWHPAKIFLGEAGSLFVGFILGVLAIISGGKIATTLLIMGLPILDVAWVIARRLFVEKRSPFLADSKHLHLRLLEAGLTSRQAVLLLWFLSAAFGVSSLFLQARAKFVVFVIVIVIMMILASAVVLAYRHKCRR